MDKNRRRWRYLLPNIMLVYSLICTMISPSGLTSQIRNAYTVLIISSWLYTLILYGTSYYKQFDVFDPFAFITILHIMLYLIAPVRSVMIGDLNHKAGTYTFDGCVKGTIIAFVSYFAIVVAYFSKSFGSSRRNGILSPRSVERNYINRDMVLVISWTMWLIGFAATLVYLAMRGMSLRYILTLGASGYFNDELALNSSYAFFSVIANIMFGSWISIFYFSKKRILVWLSFALLMLCLIVRGFRIFIVVLAAAPIILHYLKRNTRPKARTLLLVTIVMALMVGIIGWSRGALRTNGELSLSSFETDMIFEAIWGNFDIYKTYYGVVSRIPSRMDYTLGQQMILYTLAIFVPRAIWPNKPQPIIRQVIAVSVNNYALMAGSAYPALGEWYHEFGVPGCVVIAFISGRLLKRLWNLSRDNSIISLMLFSILLPSLLQVCIRGYTPSNFWMIITMVLPLFVIRATCGDENVWSE